MKQQLIFSAGIFFLLACTPSSEPMVDTSLNEVGPVDTHLADARLPMDGSPPLSFAAIHAFLADEFNRNDSNTNCFACHARWRRPEGEGEDQFLIFRDAREMHEHLLRTVPSEGARPNSATPCAGFPLVVPGDPERSLLYRKVVGRPPCGEGMSLGKWSAPGQLVVPEQPEFDLTPQQIELLRLWIEQGALE